MTTAAVRICELSYYVQIGKKQRCLLNSITTNFATSAVTVLMGHSGAGKTTLMDLIAGRKLIGIQCGNIFFDEKPDDHRSCVAYVQSSDVHIGEFTVLENLYFASRLKLGSKCNPDECSRRCLEVAASLGLDNALQVIVGSSLVKGISGGQKKRLSIAIELLDVPSILCLDEPTTGLDSSTSFQIAQTLKELSSSNKTIICTVHQPSSDMLDLWDNLILLSNGQLVYSGPINQLEVYLQRLGFQTPQNSTLNPVEYSLELLAIPLHSQALLDKWCDNTLTAVRGTNNFQPNSIDRSHNYTFTRIEIWNQIVTLSIRQGLYQWKSIHGLPAMAVRNIGGGLVFGILFFQNGRYLKNQKNIIDLESRYFTAYCTNMQSLPFTSVIFLVAINAIAVPSMNLASLLYRREQASKLYSPFAYWISILLVDTTLLLIGSAVFSLMVKFMCLPFGPAEIFFFILLLSGTLGHSQAKLCAFLSPNNQTAFVYFALLMSFEIILSGFLIFPDDTPIYFKWTMDIMFTRWAVYGLVYNQFHDFKENGNLLDGILNNQGELVLQFYGLSSFDITRSLWLLGLYFIGFELLVVLSMLPTRNRLIKTTSLSNTHILWNVEEVQGPTSGTSQSLQIDLMSSSINETYSSKSLFDRFSVPTIVSQLTPSLVEPYDKRTTSLSQSDPQFLILEGRLLPRLTYTEPRGSCQITDALEPHLRANLIFRKVSYCIKNKKGEEIKLLREVSGVVKSGELCAIMGSSGAGKTTLLNVLFGRVNMGIVTGDILVNNIQPNGGTSSSPINATQQRPQSAYVMQDDAHISVFTVRETLTFAAMLRMRETSESINVKQAVDRTLELLGLKLISESFIGTPQERTISLGQLRRVTIGVEIVHRPSLVFLDEPTSGLDSYLASTVVEGLHILSRSFRTICCTIHQPSSSVFERFDKLLLLCNGFPIYFGPISKCRIHFEHLGFIGEHANPAEFIISTATSLALESRENINILPITSERSLDCLTKDDTQLLGLSLSGREEMSTTRFTNQKNDSGLNEGINSCLQIVSILIRRDFVGLMRRKFWLAVTLRSFLFGIFLGLLWRDNENYFSTISFFFASFIATCVWVIEIVPGLHEEKLIFYRERAANATTTLASWLSMGLPMMLMSFIICIIFSIPAYYLSGKRSSFPHFAIYLSVLYLGVIIHIIIQYLCAASTPNAMIHTLIFPGLAIPFEALFCGYVVNISKMHSWYSWLVEIDPLKWYLNALFQNEFDGNTSGVNFVNFEDLESLYGWKSSISFCISILVIIAITLKCLSYFILKHVDHSSS